MRLYMIAEGPGNTLKPLLGKGRYRQLKNSLGFMPGKKVKHSLRVGATAAKAGLAPEDVEAAIMHDYIERGGDLGVLQNLQLSPRAMRVIQMLSISEKTPGMDDTNEVQHHVEQMLHDRTIPQHEKDVAIIVKCSDRIDNLSKRIKARKLNPNYKAASIKLLNTLLGNFKGDPELARHIQKKVGKLNLNAEVPVA